MKPSSFLPFLIFTGCVATQYRPALTTHLSPHTIPARVRIDQFEDLSPANERKRKALATSATAPGSLDGDLTQGVVNALLTDFEINQVFSSIQKTPSDNVDLVLKGKIHRFYGHAGASYLTWLTLPVDLLWYLNLPVFRNRGVVEIEIDAFTPDGNKLGNYRGRSQFSIWHGPYTHSFHGIGAKLNRAFSQCILEIRAQMLKDAAKLAKK